MPPVSETVHDRDVTSRRRRQPRYPVPPRPTSLADAIASGRPFVGTSAITAGLVTHHALRTRFTRLLPGVYLAADAEITKHDRIRATWLWAPSDAVIAGWAAAHLHGEHWFSTEPAHQRIEILTDREPRSVPGVRERRSRRPVPAVDVCEIAGMTTTSGARTAVDVGRWTRSRDPAIVAIDSVCNAAGADLDAVAAAAERMTGLHGVARVRRLLPHCDVLAESPQESRVRLGIARAGLPEPASQVEIHDADGRLVAVADLAYEKELVAIFYDGDEHGRLTRWRDDLAITAKLADMGWEVVRVTSPMTTAEVIGFIQRALRRARRKSAA